MSKERKTNLSEAGTDKIDKNSSHEYCISEQNACNIEDFVFGDTIGKGNFGKVRLATHVLTGEQVITYYKAFFFFIFKGYFMGFIIYMSVFTHVILYS